MSKITNFVRVNGENYLQYPEVVCFTNPKHPAFQHKIEWLKIRFAEGLRINLIYLEGIKRAVGFIEYVPGEFARRAVSAKDYMFIHCIYVYPNDIKGKGLGSKLLEDCMQDARKIGKHGLAVVTSSKAFMAGSALFLKNGFILVDTDTQGNELMVKRFDDVPMPVFNDWKAKLAEIEGLQILYSRQCPWVARLIDEIKNSGISEKLGIKISELQTAGEAQQAPSVYAVFNFIRDGRLLADRYVSFTRFNNILKKEQLI